MKLESCSVGREPNVIELCHGIQQCGHYRMVPLRRFSSVTINSLKTSKLEQYKNSHFEASKPYLLNIIGYTADEAAFPVVLQTPASPNAHDYTDSMLRLHILLQVLHPGVQLLNSPTIHLRHVW